MNSQSNFKSLFVTINLEIALPYWKWDSDQLAGSENLIKAWHSVLGSSPYIGNWDNLLPKKSKRQFTITIIWNVQYRIWNRISQVFFCSLEIDSTIDSFWPSAGTEGEQERRATWFLPARSSEPGKGDSHQSNTYKQQFYW